MSNPLNKISQVYLEQIANFKEAKVDTGSAEEKATARNKRNTPAGKDYDFDNKVFITRKPGESLESARTRKRRDAHAEKRGVKEQVGAKSLVMTGQYLQPGIEQAAKKGLVKKVRKESFSDWRTDLREVIGPVTDTEDLKQVKEKSGIKNKVIINPKLTEAIGEIGGELLEVTEVEPDLEGVVEYFYEEGINEEGIDLIIEEIGLDEFVNFVDESAQFLNEERDARRASVRAKKYDVVKKEVDKADAARRASKKGEYAPSYAKKETDVTVYDDKPAAKKAPVKKPVAKKLSKKDYDGDGKKETPKQEHRGVRNKKITKAVAKAKPAQPKKPASKEGLRDKIKSAYKAGVKRHRKATQGARVFHKGMKAGARKAVKFAKDVHKVVASEEVGVSSSAAMEKARKEAELRRKEQDIVKGVKKNFGAEDAAKKQHKEKFGGVAEAVKGQDTESRREGAKERAADKKSGKIRKNTLDPKDYATQQKKSIEWHDKRTKGRFIPGQVSDANESKDMTQYLSPVERKNLEKRRQDEAKRKAKGRIRASGSLKKHDEDGDGYVKVIDAGYKPEGQLVEKDLNAAERRALPDSDFVFPGKGEGPKGKQRGAYPIPDKKHARNALAMAAAHASPAKQAKVKAAVRKKFPGIKVSEDKAFDNVVGALRKKYGKDAVLTKDSPKPKAQPRPKAKPDTRTPEQKKKDQDHANVMARYGGEANYKAGRGLGT